MILARLRGTDLGHVYATLSADQKRALANRLVSIQTTVGALPAGRGYGWVGHYDGPFPHKSWRSVLAAGFERTCELD